MDNEELMSESSAFNWNLELSR